MLSSSSLSSDDESIIRFDLDREDEHTLSESGSADDADDIDSPSPSEFNQIDDIDDESIDEKDALSEREGIDESGFLLIHCNDSRASEDRNWKTSAWKVVGFIFKYILPMVIGGAIGALIGGLPGAILGVIAGAGLMFFISYICNDGHTKRIHVYTEQNVEQRSKPDGGRPFLIL